MTVGTYCGIGACAKCTTRGCTHECHKEKPMSTSVECPHCGRRCGSGTGLAAHIRAMHPDHARAADPLPPPRIPPPGPVATNGDGLVWEDPPGRRGPTIVQEVRPLVIELRRHPGKFARIREFTKPNAANTAASTLRKAFPDIKFVARRLPDDTSAIWAKFEEH